MNKLEKILGIKFPQGIKISNVTNSTDKVQNGSIFFGLKEKIKILGLMKLFWIHILNYSK